MKKLVALEQIKSYVSNKVYAEKYDRIFFEKDIEDGFCYVTVLKTREKIVIKKNRIGFLDKSEINNSTKEKSSIIPLSAYKFLEKEDTEYKPKKAKIKKDAKDTNRLF